MKTFKTSFPYGLNERSKDLIPGAPIGTKFYSIERSRERNDRCCYKKETVDFEVSLENFENFFQDQMASKGKDAFLKFWETLETCKKQVLNEVGLFFFERTAELDYNRQIHQ